MPEKDNYLETWKVIKERGITEKRYKSKEECWIQTGWENTQRETKKMRAAS